MKKFFYIPVLLMGLCVHFLESVPVGVRTFSVNSGLFTSGKRDFGNSNRGVALFAQEIYQAYGCGFDAFFKDNPEKRSSWAFWNLIPNYWIAQAAGTMFHEFGHWSRFKSVGVKKPSLDIGHKVKGKYHSPVPFFFAMLLKAPLKHEGITGDTGDKDFTPKDSPYYLPHETPTMAAALVFSAGGMNNAMRLSSDLSDRLYQGKGHIVEFMPYFRGRLEGWIYGVVEEDDSSGNDIGAMVGYYKDRQLDIRKGTIGTMALTSFFLSASTYSYIMAMYDYDETGDPVPQPLTFWSIRLPDFESYALREGLSLKIKTGYQINDTLHIPVAVETVVRGNKGAEVSLGLSKRLESLNNLALNGYVRFGRALEWGAMLHAPVASRAFVEGGLDSFHVKSYDGQRNIPSLGKGARAMSFIVRAGVTY